LEKIVLTTGTFNVIHAGHVQLFNFCKRYGKVWVGVNSDKYVENKYKSKYLPLCYRLEVLLNISVIDRIVIFEEEEPSNLIEKIKPDYYVKGPDYLNKDIPELNILNELSIKFLIPRTNKILSTSKLLS
jgi:rfaE bifunctional protein nucleotidyltransferase chain/domain